MLRLYNTLAKKIEEFVPLGKTVGMYTCGPTVYDFQHIGNFRTIILSDVLYRVLKFNGFEVVSVRNITDVEDKIIKKAKEEHLAIEQITRKYELAFFEDLKKLNILPVDKSVRATEHIGKMIKFIEELIKKGLAYTEADGSVYFDISRFGGYGKLSGIEKKDLRSGTRILSDEYSKEAVQDFALWKSVEADEVGWESPWGKGRPGWHIECSTMAQEYLGDSFDLHLGGVDLIFPHHENEIAQSEGRTGKSFVKYFIHGEFVLVNGEKMAKSKKNIYTCSDLEKRGFEPLAFRYLCLTAHYRDKLNFTWDSLSAAQNALNNLRKTIRDWEGVPNIGCAGYERSFEEAVNNDLNLPQALAVLWELVRSDYPVSAKAKTTLYMDQVLGLGLAEYLGKAIEIPEAVKKIVDEREEARRSGDFEKSDQLRDQIKKMGFEIEDTPGGPRVGKI